MSADPLSNSPNIGTRNPWPVEDVRRSFAVVNDWIYLDSASVGPLPDVCIEAIDTSLRAVASRGSIEHPALHEIAEDARRDFGNLIGCDASQLVSITNTSSGVSLVAASFDWREGDEVVVLDIDFPSIVLPWFAQRHQGVIVKRVHSARGGVNLDQLIAACGPRTRVLALSWVQFSSGFRADLDAIGAFCKRNGIYFVVDGMQGVGALEIDVSRVSVDVLVTQSYKWLLGPHGAGWMYLGDEIFNALNSRAAGFRSIRPQESYRIERFEPRDDAYRFETGLLNFHAIAGARASLKMLLAFGARFVEERVCQLADELYRGLAARGCDLLGARDIKAPRSAIVAFRESRRDPADCHAALRQNGIVASLREGYVRVSPHIYNSERDIEYFLNNIVE